MCVTNFREGVSPIREHLQKAPSGIGLNHFNGSKAFTERFNDMNDIYKKIEKYDAVKKSKIFFVFDDMIADRISNENLYRIVTELFIRGRKLYISFAFITQSYFFFPRKY